MRPPTQRVALSYLAAAAVTAAAVIIRWLLEPWLAGHLPLVTLFAAVAISVWLGGYRPATLSAALGYFACFLLFIAPRAPAALSSVTDIVGFLAYVLSCALIILFGEKMRRAEEAARAQREQLQITLASIGDAVITTDVAGRITSLNAVAEQLTGWTDHDARRQPLENVFRILDEQTRRTVESPAARALRDGTIVGLANHTLLLAKDGTERPIDDSAAPIRDARGNVSGCVLVFRDVSPRRAAERRRAARLEVTQVLNETESLAQAAPRVLQALCQGLRWDFGAIWLPAADGQLHCFEAYRRPEAPVAGFEGRTRQITFAPGVGLPGRVWTSGQPAWIPDVLRDDNFPRAPHAAAEGLHSALGLPLRAGGQLLGVIEFFSRAIREPDPDLLEMMATIGGQLGQFIERARTHEQLVRSEQDLSDFFENASVGLHWLSPDGTILRANRAELDLLGYAHDEYVGHNLAEFHVDDATVANILRTLRQGGTLRELPARLRRKNGEVRDVVISSNVLFANGEFVHSRCFTRDVTDQRRAEESRALLAAIVEASDDAIISKTLDGVILTWNAGAQRLFGYTAEEAIGQSIDLIIPPELRPEERLILERLQRGERVEHFETIRMAKGGRRLNISLTISPVRDRDGRTIGASKVARNITERIASEAALRESRERFERFMRHLPGLAWIKDAQGRYVFANDAAVAAFRTTREALYGHTDVDIFPPEVAAQFQENDLRALASPGGVQVIETLLHDDGRLHHSIVSKFPIPGPDQRAILVGGMAIDVTAHKEAEDALRDADRKKDEFLATLAHELRNPLAPVRNALEIMKRSRGDDEQLEKSRQTIERQVTQMVRLIDDLLDVSRITRNRLELRKERVALADVIAQALETSRPVLDAAGHELHLVLPPEPIELEADPVRLSQVFSNLLHNAAKYSDPQSRIELAAHQENGEVVVKLRDEGIGIPPEMLPHIFDMFTQVDQSLGRSQGGLGIGLTLVERLVAMHGGTVRAASEGLGRGSEFTVRLPLPAGPAASATSAEEEHPSAARRVLVVDDNRDAAETLAMLLEMMGHETRVAHDGLAAVAEAEAFRPDVVLMDIGLPLLNGYDAARRIRALPWGSAMKIIALTGWGQDDDRAQSLAAGCDAHLVKPVDHAELAKLLRE